VTASTLHNSAARDVIRSLRRNQGVLVAGFTLASVLVVLNLNLTRGFTYFDAASTASSATTLALAAIGSTIIVLMGRLDLSVGAVVSLVNCIIAVHVEPTPSSMFVWSVAGLLAAVSVGFVNALLVVLLRLPSIIVTLATMFIVEGLTLFVLEQPGGNVPEAFSAVFTGEVIAGFLPTPIVILMAAIMFWSGLRRTRFGTFIYAVGSDGEAAIAKGVPVQSVRFAAFVLGSAFYGAAGVFLTAQTGSGDPTVGPPMLLPVFVAVVLGGTSLVGGRGGCIGTLFGALTLMLIVNLMLVFNVPTFYSSVAEGVLLLLAMLAASVGHIAVLWTRLRDVVTSRRYVRSNLESAGRSSMLAANGQMRVDSSLPTARWHRWLVINQQTLRFVLPSYAALAAIVVLTVWIVGGHIAVGAYLNSLLVLSVFPAVLALGQGAVVISGGLDLSMPALITFSGVLLASWSDGSDLAALWSVPAVCVVATGIGALNGIGVALFRIHPLIMTLAMNGIIQGIALGYTGGTPRGIASPTLRWLMTSKTIAGATPIIIGLVLFVIFATVILTRTTYGRFLYATGSNSTAALFSGVPVPTTIIKTFALSGFCSALVGIMLVGFSGQAFNDMGDPYLLTTIAVVVIGGTAMTGGRGHYLGMFGGALLITALSTFLSGLLLTTATRNIIYGLVILAAIVALRERTN
jgi:ribose transport system permease protein